MSETNGKKLKKRILIAIIVSLCLVPVLFGISYALDVYENKKNNETDGPIDFDWYEADYDEDIFQNEDYVKLTEYGFILYTDGSVTIGIERENSKNYGDDVEFMVDYLYSIIEGDHEKYNSFFSDSYYKNHQKKDRFTMQKIYNVSLEKELVTKKDTGETEYTFILSYKILENNGTFRNDIGDGSKRQYITFTDRDGVYLIDSVITEKWKVQ